MMPPSDAIITPYRRPRRRAVSFADDPNLTPFAAVPLDRTACVRFARSYARRLVDEFSRRLAADAVAVAVEYDDHIECFVVKLSSDMLVWELQLAAGDHVEPAARLADRFVSAGGGPTQRGQA